MRYGKLKGEMQYIPHTWSRYSITASGSIKDHFTGQILVPDINSNISLTMSNGEVLTKEVLWFVLLAFKPIHLSLELILNFKYKIHDDYPAYDISKYIWYLDKPLELPNLPGFFTIPGYSRYAVNDKGNIFTCYGNGKLIQNHKDVRNYRYSDLYMVDDYGNGHNESIHRVIAAVFLTLPANAPELTVNHIDLNKLNNEPNNLEWISHSMNMLHSQLFHGKLKEPLIKITINDTIKFFNEINKAAELCNCTSIELWKNITGKTNNTNYDVCIIDKNNKKLQYFQPAKSVEIKDLTNDRVYTFPDMGKAASYLNVNKTAIHIAINKEYVIQQKYILRYKDTSWPDININNLSTRRTSGKRSVIIKNITTGTTETFESARNAVAFLQNHGGTKKIVTAALKNSYQRLCGNYIFKYMDDPTPWVC